MKEIKDIEELKKVELKTLLVIDKFCKEHNLKYYLAYGTLLGAIRHKGFIPWDDDIDIMMPREDYEKFLDAFDIDGFKCVSYRDKDYVYPFAKVYDAKTKLIEAGSLKIEIGIYVDIFPMDNVPNKNEKQFRRKIHYYQALLFNKNSKTEGNNSFLSKIFYCLTRFLGFFCSANGLAKKIEKVCTKTNEKPSDNIAVLTWGEKGEKYPVSAFEETVEVEFEGYKFPAPKDYDLALKVVYGDYMQLPPEDKRVSNHNFQAYHLD